MARTYPADVHLPELLRELRASQNRSQEAVAHDAGLTVAAYSRIERGRSDPSWTSVVRIADALGVSLAELGKRFDESRSP